MTGVGDDENHKRFSIRTANLWLEIKIGYLSNVNSTASGKMLR
jgi:hypothetical protein